MIQKRNLLTFLLLTIVFSLMANDTHLSKIEDFISKNKALKAYSYYENVIDGDPLILTKAQGQFMKARVFDAMYREGKSLEGTELEKESIRAYVKAIQKKDIEYKEEAEKHLLSFEQFIQGKVRDLSKKGKTFKAFKLAELVMNTHKVASNYVFLAKIEDYSRMFEKASAHYLSAISLDPNQEEKVYSRAVVLMNETRVPLQTRLDVVNKGLSVYPKNKDLLIEKLHCFIDTEESDEEKLEDLYLAIADVDSHNQYVLYALGKLYYLQGVDNEEQEIKWSQAEAYLELASKSQFITAAQHQEVNKYLREILSNR